ncbi:MAG: metallophosphoesterase family protein [Janthinobacterium lividum]
MHPSDAARGVLTWAHIGDLHLTTAGLDNHRDFLQITALLAALPPGSVDFVLLPGDNADDGAVGQYALISDAMQRFPLPVHVLPGDHDFKERSLSAFYQQLGARALPYAVKVRGHRCLFLDVVSAGTGGPDFRLGHDQLSWLEAEVEAAAAAGEDAVVFMHTYPADLREGSERLLSVLQRPGIACVDMGHTHYNELASDGSTVFMATRSTGQIEEGPPGFSIAALDQGVVGWRFKPLSEAWPFVLITHPVDRRLATATSVASAEPGLVRAKVMGGAPVATVEIRVDDGNWLPMRMLAGNTALWEADARTGASRIEVRATDIEGRSDEDVIEPAASGWRATPGLDDGSDRSRVESWAAKGIVGGQLGPNRNGRKW